jgi:hypothetical protein
MGEKLKISITSAFICVHLRLIVRIRTPFGKSKVKSQKSKVKSQKQEIFFEMNENNDVDS